MPPPKPPSRPPSLRRTSLARASVELVTELARELVEPPVQPPARLGEPPSLAHPSAVDAALGSGRYPGVAPPTALSSVRPDVESAAAGPVDGSNSSARPLKHAPDARWCEDGVRRSGGTLSATAHVITAVVGAGVLSLPAAMASLGYAGGTIVFVVFGFVTLYTAQLLADLYCVNGTRQRTYSQMVNTVLGPVQERVVAVIQLVNLVLTSVPYQIVAAKTMETLAREGGHTGPFSKYFPNVLLFGAVQLLLSQVPSLDYLEWASIAGAAASFGYSFAALGLSARFAKLPLLGSAWGAPGDIWSKLAALGNIMFAFSFAYIELELQDTVHGDGTPRGPVRPMKRACNIAVTIITCFYLAVGIAGYGVFGDGTANQFGVAIQDDILASFPAGVATWVVITANVLVLIHLVPAYAVWSQPFFSFFEQWADRAEARTGRRPCGVSAVAFRVGFRTLFVVLGTLLACAIPSLGIILGLAGALAFWPATVLFPIVCWIAVFKPRPGVKWALQGLNLACFIVTAMTAVSGVQQIVVQASQFKIFKE